MHPIIQQSIHTLTHIHSPTHSFTHQSVHRSIHTSTWMGGWVDGWMDRMNGWYTFAWFEGQIRRRVIESGSGGYAIEKDVEMQEMSTEHSNVKLLAMGSEEEARLNKDVQCW